MALAVPGVFLAVRGVTVGRRVAAPDDEPTVYRLPPNHVQDLRDVARGVEETNAGVCCRYLVDQLAGGSGGPDVDEDGYAHHLESAEKFCERYGVWRHPLVATWRNRVARCRRALSRLREAGDHASAAVLHVAHGYPDPVVAQLDLAALGELASLARYTDPVERWRLAMARAEAARSTNARSEYVFRQDRTEGDYMSFGEMIAQAGETNDMFRLAAKHAPKGTPARKTITREEGARLFDLERHRGAVEHADRAVSSGDALRDALRLEPKARGESDDHYRERRARDKDRRAAFVLEVKLAARRMLGAAERAYHDAWFRSAASGHERFDAPRVSTGSRRASDAIIPPARERGSGWSTT